MMLLERMPIMRIKSSHIIFPGLRNIIASIKSGEKIRYRTYFGGAYSNEN